MRAGVRAAHTVLVRPWMSEEGFPEGILPSDPSGVPGVNFIAPSSAAAPARGDFRSPGGFESLARRSLLKRIDGLEIHRGPPRRGPDAGGHARRAGGV